MMRLSSCFSNAANASQCKASPAVRPCGAGCAPCVPRFTACVPCAPCRLRPVQLQQQRRRCSLAPMRAGTSTPGGSGPPEQTEQSRETSSPSASDEADEIKIPDQLTTWQYGKTISDKDLPVMYIALFVLPVLVIMGLPFIPKEVFSF